MITNKKFVLTSLTVILAVFLSACGPSATPAPTEDVNALHTQVAATVVAGITQTAAAMPTRWVEPVETNTSILPSATPEPSATPTTQSAAELSATPTSQALPATSTPATGSNPTPVPVDPSTAFGCYNATFMAHVTLPYAPPFNPGDHFTKTWRVKNTGSCDWPRGFQLIFVSGDRFGADTIQIGQKVSAGAMAEISLNMTAPHLAGVVTSSWQLATEIGKPFGSVLSASITLPGQAISTPGGCLNSALLSDVSVPNGAEMKTGESFTKTWQITNTGTCTWSRDFKITFIGGNTLGSDTTKIRQIVGPGASAEISLNMTAPGSTGTFSGSWQMASDSGTLFGQIFAVSIVVK